MHRNRLHHIRVLWQSGLLKVYAHVLALILPLLLVDRDLGWWHRRMLIAKIFNC